MSKRLIFRMTAPTVAISLLLLAAGVVAAWHVHRLQTRISQALLVNMSSVRAAEELEIAVREARTQLDHFLITGDRKYLDAVLPMRREINRWLAEAERWALTPHEKALTGRAREGCQRFFTELEQGASRASTEELKPKVRALIDDVLVSEVLSPTHEYLDFNEEEVDQANAQNQTLTNWLVLGLLLLGTCGCAAGLVAGFGIARGLSRALVQLSVPIRAAAGQLEDVVGPVTFAASWDLHELEGVLRQIAERIGTVVERLRQSEREALRAEQLAAVGQMAAGMAHELRNPLTSMKILVQAASARGPTGPGGEAAAAGLELGGRDLAVLEEEITRLERLVQTFLHFARPPEPEKRRVELRELVEQAAGLVAGRAAVCQGRVECLLPPEPVPAVVDPGQVRQVLLNLLINALEAVARGGTVRLRAETGDDRWVTLRVEDDGCGLPASLGPRIFAPFVSTKETGLGLGLSICKRIVEAHGGTIDAANRSEGGAAFTVRLPLARSEGKRNHEVKG
jgi:signal transduction histidine kinase